MKGETQKRKKHMPTMCVSVRGRRLSLGKALSLGGGVAQKWVYLFTD